MAHHALSLLFCSTGWFEFCFSMLSNLSLPLSYRYMRGKCCKIRDASNTLSTIGNPPTSREYQTGGLALHLRHLAASLNLGESGYEWMTPWKEEPPDESSPTPARYPRVPRQFRFSLSSRQAKRTGCNSCCHLCVRSCPRLLGMGEQVHLVLLAPTAQHVADQ